MFIRGLIVILGVSFSLPFSAVAQVKQVTPDVMQLQLSEQEFIASMRREQVAKLARDLEEADSRLKWVLDNWVAKPESK